MASAILCVSSRFLTAVPRLFAASSKLARKLVDQRRLVARACGCNQPADGECLPALVPDFNRHLIRGATDAARADLDRRHDVVERLLEKIERVRLALLLHLFERAIDHAFGDRLLAVLHHRVHELGDDEVVELRIRDHFPLLRRVTTRHPDWPFASNSL